MTHVIRMRFLMVFFGKPPLDRIKVALAGPVVNIVFALVFFAMLWGDGRPREKFQ